MMKKMYSAPVMEVERFDVVDTLLADSKMATGVITANEDATGYEVVIKSKW